uniref:Bradykinin-related peptides n=2 Tax=Anura TaxID=8342 RepID=BRKP2_PHYNA|nr:RecName: Full=Bradykinin-related peptides; Contains: RecName: Full=Nattererimorphin; Contains: RecName: Full=[Val1,Thr6]-bradykinyl-Ser,Pro,Ala; Contains: RecName: Full=Bradykinin; Contains: RecName: Full=Des-Arg9-bradykinin; Contains: RecName: Full=[Hyp3]-bradykinyl-Val,Asp; Flags: Precursor [Physalaemus nattereri]AIN40268.1 bradykinin precursor [Physalaemus nattereri]
MAFLKKSLFLVLFLGVVSLSFCEEEKREEHEEEKRDEEDAESLGKRYGGLSPLRISKRVPPGFTPFRSPARSISGLTPIRLSKRVPPGFTPFRSPARRISEADPGFTPSFVVIKGLSPLRGKRRPPGFSPFRVD